MNLQTYPDSKLNTVSEKVIKYLENRALKPDEPAKYRLLIGTKNIDPNRRLGEDFLYPSSIGFTLKDRLADPAGGIVPIGVVSYFDEAGQPVFKYYQLNPQFGDNGEFMLRAEVLDELEMYDFFELTSFNASCPYRDAKVTPIFERIDDEKESEVRTSKRNYLFDSLTAIRDFSNDELKWIGAAYNLSDKLKPSVLRDRLESIAEQDPKTFYETIDSEDVKIRAIIKRAKDAGIIAYTAHENKWFYTDTKETLALLERREGTTETEQFTQFLKSSANGPTIKANIINLLTTRNKKVKA